MLKVAIQLESGINPKIYPDITNKLRGSLFCEK